MSDNQKDSSIHFFVIARHESFKVELMTAQNILFFINMYFLCNFSNSFCKNVKELSLDVSEKAMSFCGNLPCLHPFSISLTSLSSCLSFQA